MTETNRNDALKKLGEMIKDVRVAMLTTVTPEGHLRSRPMGTQQAPLQDDEYLWFFTKEHSGKVEEIEDEHQVNLAYAAPADNLYISVSGRATLVKDRAKIEELWSKPLEAWFPGGTDNPELSLLRVSPEEAEYWDATSNKMVFLAGLVKAIAQGETYQPGENEKMDLG